ncbi:site-specific integrase [Pseudoflavonifractor sp. AF19-9AC]|uniref:tyrosine-type recombinase/integrase n=1 Tax=Pseudoflavonifractor sp. AF19-9AC TaxID=2292244 RepID=UPI000E49CBA9|nr:site-specific integrase [Pseudoflavonifractor sp. AF19-9AC]RHR08187.1 site-specific integrase [Pseudoflavonifractor sp. AF19-9AC]
MGKRRPSGDGMVRKREDGRWEGRIVVGHKANGDSIFRYIYADTQKELTAKLRQNINAYQGVDLTEESSMTLSQWLDKWLEEYIKGTIRESTLEGYQRDLNNHVKPHLGAKPLRKVTAVDLHSLYQKLLEQGRIKSRSHAAGLSPTTVRSIHNIIHHALRTAAENGLLPSNPADAVTPPKAVSQAKKILNHDQLDTFKAAAQQDWIWRDFFLTELTTGLRRGELCGLKWSDFDEEAGTLNVCRTIHARKGGGVEEGTTKTYAGTRTILLPSSTAQLLRERKKSALTEWIFSNPFCPEHPVSPGSAYRRLKGLLEEAGLPDLRFHDLRHTFATHALASGVDAKTLSGILGHTKASFTLDTYTHVTGDMHRNAAEIVGGFMTEPLGEEVELWQSSESGETAVST